jgi:hypothetical protein
VRVLLTRHLLGRRQNRLDLADVDQDQPALGRLGVRLHNAGHDVAFPTRVLAVGEIVLGVSQPLQDDLSGGRGGNSSEVRRGVVELLDQATVRVQFLRPDDDLAGFAVDHHPRMWHGDAECACRR